MRQICKYDKDKDLGEVIPGLAVDLQKAIESGVILDTGVLEEYNDINSPQDVVTRVRDAFHAMDLRKAYLDAGKINPNSSLSGSSEHNVSTSSYSNSSSSPSGVTGSE